MRTGSCRDNHHPVMMHDASLGYPACHTGSCRDNHHPVMMHDASLGYPACHTERKASKTKRLRCMFFNMHSISPHICFRSTTTSAPTFDISSPLIMYSQSPSPPYSSPPLTTNSLILSTVYGCLLLTFLIFLCLRFVFSLTRMGSLVSSTTVARHEYSFSSIHGLPLSV